ncbi:hypothetical protein O181_096384 [Austropuccinia psidii MF-1]|uniref:Uncharacterized protein n=1 Tax=Austropuccinia psidii MF-1 TaxID=1389203 RepID=A0A9Q3PCM0_9BASI|nr:hypothetical protein [Austropuccinia psidii MF-1]
MQTAIARRLGAPKLCSARPAQRWPCLSVAPTPAMILHRHALSRPRPALEAGSLGISRPGFPVSSQQASPCGAPENSVIGSKTPPMGTCS